MNSRMVKGFMKEQFNSTEGGMNAFLTNRDISGRVSGYPAAPNAIEKRIEATGGFEPPHKGFADLSLTTWVRRHHFIN